MVIINGSLAFLNTSLPKPKQNNNWLFTANQNQSRDFKFIRYRKDCHKCFRGKKVAVVGLRWLGFFRLMATTQ